MKRSWSTFEHALRHKRRRRKFDRRRRKKKYRSKRNVRSNSWKSRRPSLGAVQKRNINLPSPEVLSLFDEPDATIRYCNRLQEHLSHPGTSVFLDLHNVRKFTIDALILLRAIMQSKADQTQVVGNFPIDLEVASEFKASGFFGPEFRMQSNVPVPSPKGIIQNKSSNKVHAEWLRNWLTSQKIMFLYPIAAPDLALRLLLKL